MNEIIGINGNKAGIDPSKKYYVFYHYGMYAKEFDFRVILLYNKYKDSVQFFFINTDKFNSK
jgi:hypothetical protein